MNPIPANRPYFPEADRRAIAAEIEAILAGGRLTQGPWIDRLEEAFRELSGAPHAIAVNSGTSALEILLRHFDVAGGEVIVPTNTFLSTGNAVLFAGGTPVLADIHPDTLALDPDDLERRITPRTRGVIAVHIAGLVSPHLPRIRAICRRHGLFLMEDAAHAPGASLDDTMAGMLGDGGAFSFYPTKPMTTGEGGMITTADPDADRMARSLRCHGIAIGDENRGPNRNLLLRLGYNWRMSELQAVVGWYQVRRLPEALAGRRRAAEWYREALAAIDGLRLFPVPDNAGHSYYKYPVLLDPGVSREAVTARLREDHAIQCGSIYWPPCHLQPFYRERFGFREGDFPVAEDVLSRTLALPIYPDLTENDVARVADALADVLKHAEVAT